MPALWEEPGWIATPSAAMARGEGVEGAFFGRAEALGGGRVRVVYEDPSFFAIILGSPGDAFEHALARFGVVAHAEGIELTAQRFLPVL